MQGCHVGSRNVTRMSSLLHNLDVTVLDVVKRELFEDIGGALMEYHFYDQCE